LYGVPVQTITDFKLMIERRKAKILADKKNQMSLKSLCHVNGAPHTSQGHNKDFILIVRYNNGPQMWIHNSEVKYLKFYLRNRTVNIYERI